MLPRRQQRALNLPIRVVSPARGCFILNTQTSGMHRTPLGAGTIDQFVGVSLFYASHFSITSIIPSLTDDGIFDFLNSLPTLGLFQHDHLIQFIKVANSFFVITRKSPSRLAQIDGSGSGLICKLDFKLDFAEFRSLIQVNVQHRGCDKAGSLRLLAIRRCRPLDFDDRVGFLAEALRTTPTLNGPLEATSMFAQCISCESLCRKCRIATYPAAGAGRTTHPPPSSDAGPPPGTSTGGGANFRRENRARCHGHAEPCADPSNLGIT
jgi:hypothetical protein